MIDLQDIGRLIESLGALPPIGAYAVIAAGSALENLFPPVPSDTFVLLGAVLADRGNLIPTTVLLVAWTANVAGAMLVYVAARRHGPSFFAEGWGRWILRPAQANRVSRFYAKYGLVAIFFSRFLPVLRVVIPTFAGFAEFGWFKTLVPIAVASGLWYALVLYLGIFASQNVGVVIDLLSDTNTLLLTIAVLVSAGIGVWWYRTRHEEEEEEAESTDASGKRESGQPSDGSPDR